MNSERFASLTSRYASDQWLLLGVLACERKLTIRALGKALGRQVPIAWLEEWTAAELLRDAGVEQPFAYPHTPEPERAYAIDSAFRPWVLRALKDRELLGQTNDASRRVAGEASAGPFVTALYAGDLVALGREQQALSLRFSRGGSIDFVRARLREAICTFTADDWLEQTWGEWLWPLVAQVFADALPGLAAVDGLYSWVVDGAGGGAHDGLASVLAEHAILRGDSAALALAARSLPSYERAALEAVGAYVEGDLPLALEGLSRLERWQAPRGSCAPSVMALLALLALHRSPGSPSVAKRFLTRTEPSQRSDIAAWPPASPHAEVARSLRALLRRLGQPEIERRTLRAHQCVATTPTWVVFITALSVHLQEQDGVTRTGWAQRLVVEGRQAEAAGYRWFSRQCWHLAKALSDLSLTALEPMTPCYPGELLLCDLLEPEPEWRRTLAALEGFVRAAERGEGILSRRVAWYVDMVRGELAKPGLEEFHSDRGWTREKRLHASELMALRDTLPPEDVAVLDQIEPKARRGSARRAAFEALIGHPRVFNGARGRASVEVLRGTCRVETRHEHGHLIVQVEPARAEEGVNIVVEGEERLVVYRVDAALAKLISLMPTGIRIPEQQEREALPILARLAEHVELRSPALGARRSIAADPSPCLRVSPEAGAWCVEVGVRPFGENGRFYPPGLGKKSVTVHAGDSLVETERELETEVERYHEILAACPSLGSATQAALAAADSREANASGDSPYALALSEEQLFDVLFELRESTLKCALEWKSSAPMASRGTLRAGSIQGALRHIKGWYLLSGSVEIEGAASLALAELVRMPFTKSGRFIRLSNGDFAAVEARVRRTLRALASVGTRSRSSPAAEYRVPEAAWAAIDELRDSGMGLQVDNSAREQLERVQCALASESVVPEGLVAALRDYQVEGFRWLSRMSCLGLGVCLADDMGLGKTVQIIALLLQRAAAGPALVVAPTSVCRNWLDELQRFAPSLRAREYAGKNRGKLLAQLSSERAEAPVDVVVTSYALLQQDSLKLQAIEWNTAVLDEAQSIKNPRSLRARAAYSLNAHYRVALTGTPVENHLGDLWSIFHFVSPHLLGSLKAFQLNYLRPIERDGDADQRGALRCLVRPFLLRRRKDEVLRELPPVTSLKHEVELSTDEALRYGLLRRQIREKLRTSAGKRQHKLQILAEITRLRRFCCHPRLVFPDAGEESAKIAALSNLLEELRDNGHRVLVFSQFVDFLQIVREELDERGFRYLYLDGSTPKERRHARVQAFQVGEAELFLISLKAGGFGLNLTAADYVVHLDPWWNPAVEAQATDRAHRIGQHRPVTVYRLVTRDTIEENIVALHKEKRAIAEGLLEGSDLAMSLDSEELLALLDSRA